MTYGGDGGASLANIDLVAVALRAHPCGEDFLVGREYACDQEAGGGNPRKTIPIHCCWRRRRNPKADVDGG